MKKIIRLDDRFEHTGEPTVQPVLLWGLRGKPCYESLSKEASASPALEYVKHVQPEPGRTIVLVLGLGSYEFYGLNRNGDGFNEQPYRPGSSNGPGRDAWVTEEECVQHHYKSYENGHVYRHHVNKDPKKAIGRILKAFWNPLMHRVEVLEDLDNKKAPDLVEQIGDGDHPPKSMGCFPAGTPILTDHGVYPIQQIDTTTQVLTHRSQWRRVTETHKRYYHGKLYSIHTPTGDSSATSEHPYGVLPKEAVEEYIKDKGYWRRRSADTVDVNAVEWTHAECLDVGDYLITPFDTTVRNTLTETQCRLLGYYAAVGHILFQHGKIYGVEFNHNKNDAAVTELPQLIETLAPTASWHQRDRKHSKHAAHTYVYDPELAQLCIKHVGQYARCKKLSQELMQQGKEQQLALLGTWINGDGGKMPTGAFYVCSCNDQLMRQAQTLGYRCGLYGRHHVIPHKPSTIVKKATTEYRIEFTRAGCNTIAPHTVKVPERQMKGPSTGPLLLNGAVISRITDISVLDFEGFVYNFEVDGDESYVAENHAVHNCRIRFDVCVRCGNMAPTRKQYCDHAKFEMSRLGADGIRNGVLNPAPRFFDSSWVLRPADRTGYMLKKVAEDVRPYELWASSDLGEYVDHLHEKASAAKKLAVIDKVVRGYPAAIVKSEVPDAPLIEKYRDTTLPTVVANTPELNAQDLQPLSKHNLADSLSALARSGIILTTPEFLQLFMQKAAPHAAVPQEMLERLTAMQGELFELFGKNPSLLDQTLATMETSGDTDAAAQDVAQLREKRSTVSEYLYGRMTPHFMQTGQTRPQSELMEVQDPDTGRTYQTTRGAANAAHDSIARAQLGKMLGGGAMLAAAYKVLTMSPKLRPFKLPIGAGLGYAGYETLQPNMGPTYQTTSGEQIPYLTEFVEKQSSYVGTINALGQDYQITQRGPERFQRVLYKVAAQRDPVLYPILRKLARFSTLDDTGLLGHISNFKHASDGIVEESLDFDKVAELLGNLAWGIPLD